MLTVWLPAASEGEFLDALRAQAGEGIAFETGEDAPPGARVLVSGVPSAEQLDACPDLERVIIPYAGVPEKTRALLAERPPLSLHNLHHNAAPTAELAVALLLAAVKRIVPHDRDLRRGDWRRRYGEPETTTLEGRTALVLGYGAIGRRVARACLGLGMHVDAVRRSGESGPGKVGMHTLDALDELLPRADALMLCLPLTDETRGLLDAKRLALLPQGACLVNVGRGALVDEEALFEALRTGALDSAGLDVWYRYPRAEEERAETLPSALPFHELDNVVLSPHRAGLTRQNEPQRARSLLELLQAAARGDEVGNRVDTSRGY